MIKYIYKCLFNPEIRLLRKYGNNTEYLLALGVGTDSPAQYLASVNKFGVDIWQPSVDKTKEKGIFDYLICEDALDCVSSLGDNDFDVVLCCDMIEHLEKEKGKRLLKEMCRVGGKVLVYTPNGMFEQGEYGGNPYQKHLSTWREEDFVGASVVEKVNTKLGDFLFVVYG